MTNPIVRLYESEQQARSAAEKLTAEGFSEDAIFLVTPGSGGDARTPEAAARAVMAGCLLGEQGRGHAEAVQQGRSLVLIIAPFGSGQLATALLESCGPITTKSDRKSADDRSVAWDEAAPLSSAFQLRVLRRNQPTPLSTALGLPTSSRRRSSLSLMFRELTSPHFALFGRSRSIRRAAPLSSIFFLKTITARGRAFRFTGFGLPLLSKEPAPLSAKLGLVVKSERLSPTHPTPLSATIGLPTVTHGRTFRIFGELASSRFALFGRNPLISKPAPLSSLFGLKTISGRSGENWTKSFGLPLLTQNG